MTPRPVDGRAFGVIAKGRAPLGAPGQFRWGGIAIEWAPPDRREVVIMTSMMTSFGWGLVVAGGRSCGRMVRMPPRP